MGNNFDRFQEPEDKFFKYSYNGAEIYLGEKYWQLTNGDLVLNEDDVIVEYFTDEHDLPKILKEYLKDHGMLLKAGE